MKRSIRSVRRLFNKSEWDRPRSVETHHLTSTVVSDEEVELFIAHIAATGFYENTALKLFSASPVQRTAACDWVESKTDMDPVARTAFLSWARDTAQCCLYGPLQSSAEAAPPILGNQS